MSSDRKEEDVKGINRRDLLKAFEEKATNKGDQETRKSKLRSIRKAFLLGLLLVAVVVGTTAAAPKWLDWASADRKPLDRRQADLSSYSQLESVTLLRMRQVGRPRFASPTEAAAPHHLLA